MASKWNVSSSSHKEEKDTVKMSRIGGPEQVCDVFRVFTDLLKNWLHSKQSIGCSYCAIYFWRHIVEADHEFWQWTSLATLHNEALQELQAETGKHGAAEGFTRCKISSSVLMPPIKSLSHDNVASISTLEMFPSPESLLDALRDAKSSSREEADRSGSAPDEPRSLVTPSGGRVREVQTQGRPSRQASRELLEAGPCHRDASWINERRGSDVTSVTKADLDELRGCIDLGFSIGDARDPEICNMLPALELFYATAPHPLSQKQFNDGSGEGSPVSPLDGSSCWSEGSSPRSPTGAAFTRRGFERSQLVKPGECQEEVKQRLRLWAQTVACTVRVAYA
eukprot:jgi/Mesen1/2233/ME000152S01325